MRRLYVVTNVLAAEVSKSVVICENDDDVGPILGSGDWSEPRKKHQKKYERILHFAVPFVAGGGDDSRIISASSSRF